MKRGWEIKKLSELFTIKPPKKLAKEKLDDEDEISFVPMACLNIEDRDLSLKQSKQLKGAYKGYTYFADNDVLLAKITPCFENGKVGIAKGLLNGIGFGSSEFIVFRPNGHVVPEYLYYYLSQESFRDEGKNRMAGAVGHKRVSKEFIEEYLLPFPESTKEQNRIVAILDKAFTAIDKAKANAEKNLANAKELFESYLNGIFENPGEDWEEKKLGNLGTLTSSKRIFKKEYVTSGVPFYRSKEIKELAHDKEISLELFIANEKYNEIKSKFGIPQAGDILLTAVGTIGEMYVVKNNDTFYFKDGNIMWLKGFKTLDTFYLKYALTSFVKQLQSMSQGSAYNALTIEKLKKYSVPVPFMKEQKKIVQNLDVLSTKTQKIETIYQQKLNDLDELKKSILQKAFEGEL